MVVVVVLDVLVVDEVDEVEVAGAVVAGGSVARVASPPEQAVVPSSSDPAPATARRRWCRPVTVR